MSTVSQRVRLRMMLLELAMSNGENDQAAIILRILDTFTPMEVSK